MTETVSPSRGRIGRLRPSRLAILLALGLFGASETVLAARFEIPGNDPSFRSRLYTGATIGQSRLDPNTAGTVFDVDGGTGSATQLRLGIDVHNMLAVELDTSVLGSAGLTLVDATVKYSAASVSAFDLRTERRAELRSRRERTSAYLRLGLGVIKPLVGGVAIRRQRVRTDHRCRCRVRILQWRRRARRADALRQRRAVLRYRGGLSVWSVAASDRRSDRAGCRAGAVQHRDTCCCRWTHVPQPAIRCRPRRAPRL